MPQTEVPKFKVEDLTPAERAALLADLKNVSPEETLPAESDALQVKQDIKADAGKKNIDIEPAKGQNSVSTEKPIQEAPTAGDARKKGILNSFFRGEVSFDDVPVNPKNAADITQETIDRENPDQKNTD